MKSLTPALLLLGCVTALVGCIDNSPPPARVPIPSPANRDYPVTRREDEMRPLPPQATENSQTEAPSPLPYSDPPLVNQQLPEQSAFVDAYRKVGSPRIVLFVNRTLEGKIVPITTEKTRTTVDRTRSYPDPYSPYRTTESHTTTDTYLRPGQYDEVSAKSLDYEALENIMTDWLACSGQVTVVSPTMARQRLTDQQVKELQEGRPQAMSELVQELNADIFVQVQAHPTKQTQQGLQVRVIAEAMNTKGGESIGRAVVDVTTPLDKPQIEHYTRYLSRKLMDGMLGFWSAPPPAPPPGAQAPAVPPAAPPQAAPQSAPPMPAPQPAPVAPPPAPATNLQP
ncbi:MAG TPA: hypothetical protein VH518_24225 [Tepidisphaeraceae bacterium]